MTTKPSSVIRMEKRFLEAYMMYTGVPAVSVDVRPDPAVVGTYAAQFDMEDGGAHQILVVLGPDDTRTLYRPQRLADAFEEVEFDSWPPRQARRRTSFDYNGRNGD